jgi:hypothetical protein
MGDASIRGTVEWVPVRAREAKHFVPPPFRNIVVAAAADS